MGALSVDDAVVLPALPRGAPPSVRIEVAVVSVSTAVFGGCFDVGLLPFADMRRQNTSVEWLFLVPTGPRVDV
jgi:hypothetical protein